MATCMLAVLVQWWNSIVVRNADSLGATTLATADAKEDAAAKTRGNLVSFGITNEQYSASCRKATAFQER